jgi:hypothetical protein
MINIPESKSKWVYICEMAETTFGAIMIVLWGVAAIFIFYDRNYVSYEFVIACLCLTFFFQGVMIACMVLEERRKQHDALNYAGVKKDG